MPFCFLQNWKNNNHSMDKITIWSFNVLTQWPMNSPMISIQVTIMSFFDNFVNKLIDLMLKQPFFKANSNHKHFRWYSIINQNKPSLLNGKNKLKNFRHEHITHLNLFNFGHFFQPGQKIYFFIDIFSLNILFTRKLIFFYVQ